MVSPLGALGGLASFAGGVGQGMESGLQMADQIANLQAQQLLGSSLGSLGGWAQPATGAIPSMPMTPPAPPPSIQPPAAPGPPQAPAITPPQPPGQFGPQGPMVRGQVPLPPPRPDPMQTARTQLAANLTSQAPLGYSTSTPGQAPAPATPPSMPPQPPPQPQLPPQAQPQPQQQPGPPQNLQPPSPDQADLIQSSTATPNEMRLFQQFGVGWMSPQELAARIQQANPNASPLVKFKAMQMGMKLLNPSGQNQFSQIMQMMRESRMEEAQRQREQRAETRETQAQSRLDIAQRNQLLRDPYVQNQRKLLTNASTALQNTEIRVDKLKYNLPILKEMASKLSITGNPTIDQYITNIRKTFDPSVATRYETALRNVQTEVAQLSRATMGALTEGAARDAQNFANGIMSPKIIDEIEEALKLEGTASKKVYKGQIDRANRNIRSFLDSGGLPPEDDDVDDTAATTTPPPAATPAPGWGKATAQ